MASLVSISVPNIVSDISTYNRVEIGRADSESDATSRTGTWSSIGYQSLVANVGTYDYTDNDGTSVSWYSYRLNNSGTGANGSWSDPAPGRHFGYLSAAEFREYEMGDLTNPDGSDISDNKIRQLIKVASSMVDSYVGYTFDHRSSTEKHRWDQHTRRIYPIHRSIISVESVKIYVSAQQSASFTVNDIFINSDRGYVEITSLANVTYSLFPAIVALGMIEPVAEITYTHGASVPPQDIKDATALIAIELLARDGLAKQGLQAISRLRVGEMEIYTNESGQGGSRQPRNPAAAIPLAATLLLDQYIRPVIK